ncbi:MAG TPA: TIGR00266 family protein [Lentisphaeria bacterium]|nr:TIGR00266 family protein [Lentisphaerota bacterium]OQC17415.1 MAG: hypothetical protein BWX73_00237 [Lentisphaerae bacterium ADurb.Bin082]HQC52604.1 TIGR00266 family protein [Lentisphaeria bacterium]HQL87862.1 TIGR00266 family protein [Lentisphaeria bacterium]
MQYQIIGEPLPAVICTLEAGEAMHCESGAMSWMTPNMQMETSSGGGVGKVFGRMLSGENLFLNKYTATGGAGTIAFASSFPGSIRAFEISPGHEIIAQKGSFLASSPTVEMSMFFQKKFGAGLFGGEGFIMQKFSGSGIVFIEIDGTAVEYDLAESQSMIVDTGYLAAMSSTCKIDVRTVPGLKNMVFGGEGIFNTVITGPGHIILQTMPIRQLAKVLRSFLTVKR